ncbi:pimeloyl-ACP methyl ester carboxylesterase [Arthrobacter sp. PvP102]|uniref:alpha/beta fold hydrolase n=1 Tax=unclassified Arthrobacter TaxID=235627 RepID=UPI001AE55E42|nr:MULTISPECIES: alpha/beta hydrolase [unclassified Arthrobacter]MBP1233675.1 pimeloyl-ACP methyl ester carboxylesterase [Arthrobacter sp. PvP103]MBP1238810.1 pimeloyl-ACP methyl ester carboxylesterase [Arthrobacter sp. PvP102]
MKGAVTTDVEAGGLRGRMYASRATSDVRPRADAPTFVLIHGIGVSHRYLVRLHHVLAGVADTISIDLPGFGSTPRPDRQLMVADQAAFIHDVLDQAGVGPRVLVGHSMGAQFVLEAALQRPEQVPHVVLMGPVVDVRRRTLPRQILALTKDALLHETPGSNALVFSDYLRCGPLWYLKELRVMMNYRTEERIRGLTTPVMILRGASDPIATGEWCRILARRAPAGTLVEVPGCGHVVQHTGTAQVADAITGFTGLPGSGAPEQTVNRQ